MVHINLPQRDIYSALAERKIEEGYLIGQAAESMMRREYWARARLPGKGMNFTYFALVEDMRVRRFMALSNASDGLLDLGKPIFEGHRNASDDWKIESLPLERVMPQATAIYTAAEIFRYVHHKVNQPLILRLQRRARTLAPAAKAG